MLTSHATRLALVAAIGAFSVASCSQENDSAAVQPAASSSQSAKVEEAYPGQNGNSQAGYLSGQPIEYRSINGENIYEGDIILTSEQVANTGARPESAGRTSGRWPSAVVYYTIDAALPSQNRVTDAIAHWQTNTAIRFVKRTTQANYVTFRVGSGCSSNIGMIGGRQYINLASGCSTGNTIHEIGHALGLFHEQTRNDRDTYVNILTQNIQAGYENNFSKYSASGYAGTDYGVLDFGSIMMYGSFSFSSNGQPTITKKDGSTFDIQRSALSTGDKAGIDAMY
ncbi:M12 family metallopeptidase [Hymenobacter sp. HSC-4F20]|uniref:M12 family metallopeptidase n=1 Tax=Hymenobacter sp. HSC-4F20 TaxID=2864135 RepID=UPI001C73D7F3|nr:M12 family metallopeptidase [Hymenobacter sp. HSC-4F20]MBX0292341.1 M12 family metallopeptidase [Hymenobacter sp. HSC-4F20]